MYSRSVSIRGWAEVMFCDCNFEAIYMYIYIVRKSLSAFLNCNQVKHDSRKLDWLGWHQTVPQSANLSELVLNEQEEGGRHFHEPVLETQIQKIK